MHEDEDDSDAKSAVKKEEVHENEMDLIEEAVNFHNQMLNSAENNYSYINQSIKLNSDEYSQKAEQEVSIILNMNNLEIKNEKTETVPEPKPAVEIELANEPTKQTSL